MQLRRVGVKKPFLLKGDCRDFENYMELNYDYQIVKKKAADKQPINLEKK